MEILNNFKYLGPFVVLDIVLKALALWKSARANQKIWFISLLLINSLSILPAIYLIYGALASRKSRG